MKSKPAQTTKHKSKAKAIRSKVQSAVRIAKAAKAGLRAIRKQVAAFSEFPETPRTTR